MRVDTNPRNISCGRLFWTPARPPLGWRDSTQLSRRRNSQIYRRRPPRRLSRPCLTSLRAFDSMAQAAFGDPPRVRKDIFLLIGHLQARLHARPRRSLLHLTSFRRRRLARLARKLQTQLLTVDVTPPASAATASRSTRDHALDVPSTSLRRAVDPDVTNRGHGADGSIRHRQSAKNSQGARGTRELGGKQNS